jgi:hypothetical protein
VRRCEWCGKKFRRREKTGGEPQRFCSGRCRTRASHARHKAREREYQQRPEVKARRRKQSREYAQRRRLDPRFRARKNEWDRELRRKRNPAVAINDILRQIRRRLTQE